MNNKNWWKSLQPVRIPSDWKVIFNKLESIEPDTIEEDDKIWLFHFVQDILYFEKSIQEKRNKKIETHTIGIDLGWYPDGDPNGAYELKAIWDQNWNEPILTFTSRSTQDIVDTMELWLFQELPFQINLLLR